MVRSVSAAIGRCTADPGLRKHNKGWPTRPALAAAVFLHAIALIAMLPSTQDGPSRPIEKPIAVDLVFAPEPPVAERTDPPQPQSNVPADDATLPITAVPNPEKAPEVVASDHQTSSPADRPTLGDRPLKKKKHRPAPDVAIYNVVLDDGGNIWKVTLIRSSGIRSFDEAGKEMIYNGMALLPSARETTVLTVTLHFSREKR